MPASRHFLARHWLSRHWLATGASGSNTLLDDLVAMFKMDEASGTRIDSHGSYDLDENNTVGSATGKINDAAHLILANAEYLDRASHDAALAADGGLHVAGWLKAAALLGTQRIAGEYNTGIGGSSWLLFLSGTTATFRVADGSTGVDVSFGTALSTSTWYYVEAWFDLSAQEVSICVTPDTSSSRNADATPVSTSAITVIEGNAPFAMGSKPGGGAGYFDGDLDEWGVWGTKKSTSDRDAAFDSGSALAYSSWQSSSGATIVVPVWAIYAGAAT